MSKRLKYFFLAVSCLGVMDRELLAALAPHIGPESVQWYGNSSQIQVVPATNGLNTYSLKTNALLRDNIPASKELHISEHAAAPFVRSDSPLFDGLFALSLQELQQSSVNVISDSSFEPTNCNCFETGAKWKYVWTRDISYATDLGLASIDPIRAMNSLEFKLSNMRDNLGSGEQIVQDTGTGGSWPISTDRMVWGLGAQETLRHLPYQTPSFQRFYERSYRALKNSALVDRQAVYDRRDGLYTGEQSFLDWREQSNPDWTRSKVVHIGMSKALSTNVVHYLALKQLSEMAQVLGLPKEQQQFQNWATNLKSAILKNFWDGTSLRSIKPTFLDQRAIKFYDLLGISLAILAEIPSPAQAKQALASYPHTQVGAPVIWPQIPDTAIYHNRAIWPLVSAYGLKAATKLKSASLITAFARSLILGPALNLSNMENFEFLTLSNWQDDGNHSGPVVNSQRQLWSTAGHLSLVLDTIFGKQVKLGAIRFNPSIAHELRKQIFGTSSQLKLHNLRFQNRRIDVQVYLPALSLHEPAGAQADGLYTIDTILLNGKKIPNDQWIETSELSSGAINSIQIHLTLPLDYDQAVNFAPTPQDLTKLNKTERQLYFQPKAPRLSGIGVSDNFPLLSFQSDHHEDVTYLVFKNGELLTRTKNTHYLDKGHALDQTACYSIVASYDYGGNESFPSEPSCYWPQGAVQHYPMGGHHIRVDGVQQASVNGKTYLKDWGRPDQKIRLENFKPYRSGRFALQVDYSNLSYINTGITCGVKKLSLIDEATGLVLEQGVLAFPHHGEDRFWTDSNFIAFNLDANKKYAFVIEDFQNMSYFKHFESYKFRGGKTGHSNQFNFADIKILYLGN